MRSIPTARGCELRQRLHRAACAGNLTQRLAPLRHPAGRPHRRCQLATTQKLQGRSRYFAHVLRFTPRHAGHGFGKRRARDARWRLRLMAQGLADGAIPLLRQRSQRATKTTDVAMTTRLLPGARRLPHSEPCFRTENGRIATLTRVSAGGQPIDVFGLLRAAQDSRHRMVVRLIGTETTTNVVEFSTSRRSTTTSSRRYRTKHRLSLGGAPGGRGPGLVAQPAPRGSQVDRRACAASTARRGTIRRQSAPRTQRPFLHDQRL
jgi:hypothetical protein